MDTKENLKIGGIATAILVLLIIGLLILAFMSVFGWGFFKRTTADFRGETGVIENTKANASFRISSHNLFFDACASIQGDEGRIKAQELLLTQVDRSELSRIQTNIAALQGSREAKINRYNTDAGKAGTIGQFRDSKLPYQINSKEKETKCVIE